MYALQLASGYVQVTCLRRSGAHTIGIEAFRQFLNVNRSADAELHAFGLHYVHTAVDDRFVELEVRYSEAQQSADIFVFLEHCHLVAHGVKSVGSGKSRRTGSHDGHFLAVALVGLGLHIALSESRFYYGGLIFAYSHRRVDGQFKHTTLLAECRTDASGELREVVRGTQYLVSFSPFSLVQRVLKLRRTVAQRACPMAERHTAVHTT